MLSAEAFTHGERRGLSVLVTHAAVAPAVARWVVVLRVVCAKALVAASYSSLGVVVGLVVETFITVVLVTSCTPRHLARVGSAVRVSARPSLVLVETLLSLPITLAVLVIGALAWGAAGLVTPRGSSVGPRRAWKGWLPSLVHGGFLFGGFGCRSGSVGSVILVV